MVLCVELPVLEAEAEEEEEAEDEDGSACGFTHRARICWETDDDASSKPLCA